MLKIPPSIFEYLCGKLGSFGWGLRVTIPFKHCDATAAQFVKGQFLLAHRPIDFSIIQ